MLSWEHTTRPRRHIVEVIEGGAGGRQQQIIDLIDPKAVLSDENEFLAILVEVLGTSRIAIYEVGSQSLLDWYRQACIPRELKLLLKCGKGDELSPLRRDIGR